MQTIESLKRQLESTQDLQSVVKTMKAMAAVNIRQYQRAAEAVEEYYETVLLGLQIVLRSGEVVGRGNEASAEGYLGAVVFGSDQGMCGRLNEEIFGKTQAVFEESNVQKENRRLIVIGERLSGLFEDVDESIEEYFSVPTSARAITPVVQDIVLKLVAWYEELGVGRISLFYNDYLSGASYRPTQADLLPLDEKWLQKLQKREWPTRSLPMYTMGIAPLFSSLLREYLFVSLFRAFAESLASENASRLASMQGAEKNIEERLGELTSTYHQRRQMAITEELLDIVAGFEALKETA